VNEKVLKFFFQFHYGVLRMGPGTDSATRKAFAQVGPFLPPKPRILDVGCGKGAQTLALAAQTEGTLVAVDLHEPFITDLRRRVSDAGLAGRIDARVADMAALPFSPGEFDLIWSEGAIYNLGFENGLRTLRPLLAEGGAVVVTEASWLRSDAPEEVREFWASEYPAMTSIEENLNTIRRAGYRALGHFVLEREGWSNYVDPLEHSMQRVLAAHPEDPDALAAAEMERREFRMFRTYLDYFGYVFYLMRAESQG